MTGKKKTPKKAVKKAVNTTPQPIECEVTASTPISIIVSIKDLSLVYYSSPDSVLIGEIKMMEECDAQINASGKKIQTSYEKMQSPEGFQYFAEFLDSINAQASLYPAKVELIVIDWSSIDADVEKLIPLHWEGEYKVVPVPHESPLNTTHSKMIAEQHATYDLLHFTEPDMVYVSPDFLFLTEMFAGAGTVPFITTRLMTPSGLTTCLELNEMGVYSTSKKNINTPSVQKATIQRSMIHQWRSAANRAKT